MEVYAGIPPCSWLIAVSPLAEEPLGGSQAHSELPPPPARHESTGGPGGEQLFHKMKEGGKRKTIARSSVRVPKLVACACPLPPRR